MTDPEHYPAPSLGRRLAAILYDALLVAALVFVINALALAVLVKLSGGGQTVVGAHLAQALTLISLIGFFSAFWLKSGQTLGMQAWRIKLVNFDGGQPSVGQAIIRCLAAVLSAACLGLGYLWCLFDRNGHYWHDYLSGTELILLPKPEKRGK